jgi:GNAT superfamily N-acetyltransferase
MTAATIRTFRPGDMGHIAGAQAALYAEGYGWGRPLEILILDTVSQFLRDYREGRDQCFVAEMDGRVVGSCFITDDGDGRARLRLVYVDAAARGQGLGQKLVGEAVDFAKAAGYRAIWLWTHAVLTSARRIYDGAGFRCTERFIHDEFGAPVDSENWELILE